MGYKNPETKKKAVAADYQKNKDRYDAATKEWNRKNPGRRSEISRKWATANPEKFAFAKRTSRLKAKYGIGVNEYNHILETQDSVCKICKEKCSRHGDILSVDHDHITGKVRGLLCRRCNAGLGMFMDSPRLMEEAVTYLLNSEEYV